MACKRVNQFLFGPNRSRIRGNKPRDIWFVRYYSTGEESPVQEREEKSLSPEWYEKASFRMKKWSHSLKEMDLIGGRLVNMDDYSVVFEDKLERRMHTFKNIARVFIAHPSLQEAMRRDLIASNPQYSNLEFFSERREREPLLVNSLTKVSDILGISAQQRKVVRHTICPQVTQHDIWTGALVEILNGLKSDIQVLMHRRLHKEIRLAQQIVVNYVKLLESAMSYDPEKSSWMRLTPMKEEKSPDSPTWEDALEMSHDLVNCLSDELGLAFHLSKLEAMKEGLYQIKDILIDKSMGYKESRFQEHLVQKKLTKTLGHSSRCLFTLLLYYLYGTVRDVEVEVCGGLHTIGSSNKFCLYMGKVLTADEERVVWNGVRQLDGALGLFKFVWQTAGVKGDLELQGHLWCFGAQNKSFSYRGNVYYLHGINL